jgi:hypothetical protein
MVKLLEIIIVVLGPWSFLFGLFFVTEKPVFFQQILPLSIVFALLSVWYYLLVKKFRDGLSRAKLFFKSVGLVSFHCLMAYGVQFKWNTYFVKAVSAIKNLPAALNFPPLAWGVGGLLFLSFLIIPFFISSMCEKWLKNKTQNVFISHQERIATFLNEDEAVKKAFLAYEGWSLLWSILFRRTVLLIWTNARLIIITESIDKNVPAHIRSLTLISMRAIRARDAFFSPFSINVEVELLNRLRISLWPLSKSLGEDMAEALATAVQTLKVMQGVYEGPVVNHICPFCFADAGKGRTSFPVCPVCGRNLRESFLRIASSYSHFVVPLLVIIALLTASFRPTICGISRGLEGERVILDSDRIRAFDSSGNILRSSLLPNDIRNSEVFVKTIGGDGIFVGGKNVLYKWHNNKFSVLWRASSEHQIVGLDKHSGSDYSVITTEGNDWYVFIVDSAGKVKKKNLLSCLIDKPAVFIGMWKQKLLFSMEGGGVAMYLVKGSRDGWLVHPDDSGFIQGGVVFSSSTVGLVDLEQLSALSISSDRADIVYSLDADGVIMTQVSLGESRQLPRLMALLKDGPEDTIRPDLICGGTGSDIWILDKYSARFVRVTRKGEIVSDLSRGRLSQWISEVRIWMTIAFISFLSAVVVFLTSIVYKIFQMIRA